MKVLIGQFVTESNANIPHQCEITDYDIAFGEECIQKMQIRPVFEKHGIELIRQCRSGGRRQSARVRLY